MSDRYRITYGEEGAAEISVPSGAQRAERPEQSIYPPGVGPYAIRYREPLRVPAIINTGLTLIIAAGIFFGAERHAPHAYKPSTLVGGYEASVDAQLKAAELNEQARFEAYQAQLRIAAETQVKETEKLLEGVQRHYEELFIRGRIVAQAATDLQTRFVAARMAQREQVQATDMSLISVATLFGRVMNLVEPGSGDEALGYAGQLEQGVIKGLTQAAQEGAQIDITSWDKGLPTPEEMARAIDRVPVMTIPEPPHLARHTSAPANDAASPER